MRLFRPSFTTIKNTNKIKVKISKYWDNLHGTVFYKRNINYTFKKKHIYIYISIILFIYFLTAKFGPIHLFKPKHDEFISMKRIHWLSYCRLL